MPLPGRARLRIRCVFLDDGSSTGRRLSGPGRVEDVGLRTGNDLRPGHLVGHPALRLSRVQSPGRPVPGFIHGPSMPRSRTGDLGHNRIDTTRRRSVPGRDLWWSGQGEWSGCLDPRLSSQRCRWSRVMDDPFTRDSGDGHRQQRICAPEPHSPYDSQKVTTLVARTSRPPRRSRDSSPHYPVGTRRLHSSLVLPPPNATIRWYLLKADPLRLSA